MILRWPKVFGGCFLAYLVIFVTSCNTPHGDLQSLLRDVDSYHRDLLFERYEIAAKKISPSERVGWLSAMKSSGLRFAEIEVMSTQPCSEYTEECFIIDSQVMMYSGNSPTVSNAHVTTTWQFDKETKDWLIVEMSQN